MTASPSSPAGPFDRAALRHHRSRAAAAFARHDFLVVEAVARLEERLGEIRPPFPRALVLGGHTGTLARLLARRPGTDVVLAADPAPAMARQAGGPGILPLAADEEWLPCADGSLDLVASALSLQWVNDLPGALVQIRRALRPDGLFLAVLPGGQTLWQLRQALAEAESRLTGRMTPRVSPMVQLRDLAGLLQRAGFALPVADAETLTVTWPDPLALLRELRAMGETNALAGRVPLRRAVLLEGLAHYARHHAEADGRIVASIEFLFAAGWAPAATQQRPLRPGSARHSLAAALGTVERPAGDPVP